MNQSRTGATILAAVCLAALAAEPAAAQQTIADPTAGRYFSTFWLVLLILQLVVWIAVFDWVGRDSEKLGGRQQFWCTIIMAAGGVGVFIMLAVSMAFAFLAILGLLAILGAYIYKRNRALPEERRVLTGHHLSYMLRLFAERLKLRRSAGAVVQGAGKREDTTTIELLRKDGTSLEKLTEDRSSEGSSEAVVSIKELVESAVLSRATDIHIEPKENELQARFRIDGILHNVPSYPPQMAAPMISSVKVLSDMDIAEKRKSQDGSFMGRLQGRTLDFRVATAASVHGETMVIRILDRDLGIIRLEKLGMLQDNQVAIRRLITYPNGMIIVSGPTGSGKSTTLYAMLSEIDAYQKNIITIEDPIEYKLDNVTQQQVNVKAGVTFPGALRSMLRQDPDVIMVGEIRDAETARVACQAAMTGHLVFSTIHANDSITSLFRLLDLGVESYFISSSLTAVLAQRLVRALCPTCKVAYVPDAEFLKKIGIPADREVQLYKSQGCEECQGTGYKGRIGIFELFELNDKLKDLVRTNPSVQLIRAEAKAAGMRKLHEDGLVKVIKGTTSIKELLRVTR